MSEMAYRTREEQDRHTLYSRIKDLEAEVARLEKRSKNAEAKQREQERITMRYIERLHKAEAQNERLRDELGDAVLKFDMIGWELEKPTVDRSWLASVAHTQRDLCRAALRGEGEK